LDDTLVQRYILAVLYITTRGDDWTHCSTDDNRCGSSDGPIEFDGSEPWLTGATECEWAGVDCNIVGFVSGLKMNDNNLDGIIPPELISLDELDDLELRSNALSGSIPPDGFNPGLIRLKLDGNPNLGGNVPVALGSDRIITLWLQECDFTGGLEWIGAFVRVRQLFLSGNRFAGSIPESIGRLLDLRVGLFNENDLTGAMPNVACTELNALVLSVDCDEVSCSCCTPTCDDTDGRIRRALR